MGSEHIAADPVHSRATLQISRPHDPAEREADRAADVVSQGGSVASWSFASVPVTGAAVHRQGTPQAKSEGLAEGAGRVVEAAAEVPQVKAVIERIKAKALEDPLVKSTVNYLESPAGIATALTAAGGYVTVFGAAGKPLPVQLPEIPLTFIAPGLSGKVTFDGPPSIHTFGITLKFREQVAKGRPGPTESDRIRADIRRLKAEQEMFKPAAQKDAERRDERDFIAHYLTTRSTVPGLGAPFIPLGPGAPATLIRSTGDVQPEKVPEDAPVQRQPSSTARRDPSALDTSGVGPAVQSGGRGLEPQVRQDMERRFGHDFGAVRIHDDAAAHAGARGVEASAFTVGQDIVFAQGAFDPDSAHGTRLLAHELAHVVQQSPAGSPSAPSMTNRTVSATRTPLSGATTIHRQAVPAKLRQSVNLGLLTDEQLAQRHDDIVATLAQFNSSTADTALLEWEAGQIGAEIGRREALRAGRTFDATVIAVMRDYFVRNATSGHDSCIVAMNKALKLATGNPALPTTPESIEKSMAKVAAAGSSGQAREIAFLGRSGRVTSGGARPTALASSVWDGVVALSGGDVGWSVFTMSLLDGYHSVTLTLDATNPSAPHIYWSDQWSSKGGWKEYTRSQLDAEVLSLVQGWWDGQEEGKKHHTVVRLWRVHGRAAGGPGGTP